MSEAPARAAPDGSSQQRVYSPEQVELHLPIAGPTSRILAFAVDTLFILLLQGALIAAAFAMLPAAEWLEAALDDWLDSVQRSDPTATPGISVGASLLLGLLWVTATVTQWLYFVVAELTTGGRSPGKHLLGLRVAADGGGPIGWRQSLLRNLLRAVDMLPAAYLVGLVSVLLSPDGKRLGDLASGTVVLRADRPGRVAPLPTAPPPEASRFRFEHRHLEALGAAERRLLRQTLRRLETLSPDQADAAAARSAEALRARMNYEALDPGEERLFLRALLHALQRQ